MKIYLGAAGAVWIPVHAFAQTAVTTCGGVGQLPCAPPVIDFTAITIAVVGGVFAVIGAVATALVNKNVKDKQAADTLNTAITNSLGAVQNAVDTGLTAHPLQKSVIGLSPAMAAGVQYTLDHAGDEAKRLDITPAAIADKIEARMGLAKIPVPPTVPVVAPLPAPPVMPAV